VIGQFSSTNPCHGNITCHFRAPLAVYQQKLHLQITDYPQTIVHLPIYFSRQPLLKRVKKEIARLLHSFKGMSLQLWARMKKAVCAFYIITTARFLIIIMSIWRWRIAQWSSPPHRALSSFSPREARNKRPIKECFFYDDILTPLKQSLEMDATRKINAFDFGARINSSYSVMGTISKKRETAVFLKRPLMCEFVNYFNPQSTWI
jgi:hypothetical protein